MSTFFSLIFYLGIFTSIYGGVGLKFGFVTQEIAALYGIMGLLGTGIGYAGRHYFIKMRRIEGMEKKNKTKKKQSPQ
jgi:hypothetical protein